MAINQQYTEERVLELPLGGVSPGNRYYLNVGGGEYQTYIVSDSLEYVKESGKDFIECDTVSDMRSLDSRQIWSLQNGYYKGVRLHGYDSKGDTPAPIEYYLSDTTEVDDGGSVVEVGGVKLEHEFGDVFNVRYFGAKCDYNTTSRTGTDDITPWRNALLYQSKNQTKEILFDKYTLISDTITLYSNSKIRGTGVLTSGFYCSYDDKNVLQYLNGHEVVGGIVTNWGSQCQVSLRKFVIGCSIPKAQNEFGQSIEFVNGTAIHLEGFRYRGVIEEVRCISPFFRAFYGFGSWGSTISKMDVLRGQQGWVFDSGSNGVKLLNCLTQRIGNINDVNNSGGVILTGYGDAENQRGNGNNVSIEDSIFESGNTGAPAIQADNINNLSIKNTYIERQTRNRRSIILSNCKGVDITNVNVENSLGIQLDNCQGVSINGYALYTTDGDYPSVNALTLIGTGNRDIEVNGSTYEGKKLDLTSTQKVDNLILNKSQAESLPYRPYFDIYNHFVDPVFVKKIPFSSSAGVVSSYESNGLRLTFPATATYDFSSFTNGGYTSQGSGNVNLIVHMTVTGKGSKRLTMTRSSGGAVTKDFDFEGEGVLAIRTPTSTVGGVSHNFRIGVLEGNTSDVIITVHGVYLGEYNYSALLREVPVDATTTVKGLVNQAASVPNGSSVDDVLQALRDAGLMAT